MEERALVDYNGLYTGRRIKKLRKELNLSGEECSSQIGCSISHLFNIESGNTKPSLDILMSLSSIFGITIDELLFEDNEAITTRPITDIRELKYRMLQLMDRYEPKSGE